MLAEQMASLQADLVKNEVLVKEIKNVLVEKKKEQIRRCIEGNTFKIDGKGYTALGFNCFDCYDHIAIRITFGLEPSSFSFKTKNLNANEKRLVKRYVELYNNGAFAFTDELTKAEFVARELESEKHEAKLTTTYAWDIDYGKTMYKGFFDKTCITLPIHQNDDTVVETDLEDLYWHENI